MCEEHKKLILELSTMLKKILNTDIVWSSEADGSIGEDDKLIFDKARNLIQKTEGDIQ